MKKPSSSQPNTNPTPTALSIERVQGIGIDANGNTAQWEQLYLKIFQGFVSSGLAARLGGNAALVLITLGLHAGVLGDPQRANAEDEFKLLRELGIVTAQDRGKLFTFIGQATLAEKLKMDRGTISTQVAKLVSEGIVEKRSTDRLRLPSGKLGNNFLIIRPESHIGRFAANKPAAPPQTGTTTNQGEIFPLVTSPGGNFQHGKSRTNKSTTKEEEEKKGETPFDIIASTFARAVNAPSYALNDSEIRKLTALIEDGFTLDEIIQGIQASVQHAIAHGRHVQSINYCITATRKSRNGQPNGESSIGKGIPAATTVTGHPSPGDELPPTERSSLSLDDLAAGNTELRDLLELVQECNPSRALKQKDVQAWLAVGAKHSALAEKRNVTQIALLKQAVLHGIGAQSDRDGYFTATLADAILEDWTNGDKKPSRKNGNGNHSGQPPSPAGESKPVKKKYESDNGWEKK